MVNTILEQYVALVETFGLFATWSLLVYMGALGALAVNLARLVARSWVDAVLARQRRRRNTREVLELLEHRKRLDRIMRASDTDAA